MKETDIMEDNFLKWVDILTHPRTIKKDYNASKNVNSQLCAKCGGACCKKCGCHFSPEDFKEISFESLKQEMDKGYISIDYVDREQIYSDFGIYILRVRNQGAPIIDTGFIRARTPCILLTEKGCKLDYEHRPTGGKLVIPNEISAICHEMTCKSTYDIIDCCREWEPYQGIICQLISYYRSREIPCSL